MIMGNIVLYFIYFCLASLIEYCTIRICHKYNIYDSINDRKVHSGNIPRLGGIGFVVPFLISIVVYFIFLGDGKDCHIIYLAIAALIIFLGALVDDLFELKAVVKLIIQIGAALCIIVGGFRYKQIFFLNLPVSISYVLTLGWIIGIVNAYNLIDGLDCLCGGLAFVTVLMLGFIFMYLGDNTYIICFSFCSAILGFLLFNFPPAKIFMGDCGSQFIGFMIAVLPLFNQNPQLEYNKFIFMILITSIPAMDTIAAIWRRKREHRSIMSPDKRHTHHKLLSLGLNKTQVMLCMVGFQILICASCYISIRCNRFVQSIILISSYIAVIVVFDVLHFVSKSD